MKKSRIHYLYEQYADGRASNDEIDELTRLLSDPKADEVVSWLDETWGQLDNELLKDMPHDRRKVILAKILKRKVAQRGGFRRVIAWSAAAAVILFGVLTYQYQPSKSVYPQMLDLTKISIDDVDPGTERAILTLADGRKLMLNGYDSDQVIGEPYLHMGDNTTDILVHLPRESWTQQGNDKVSYNELRTPAGGQYRVMLPDGTKVTLNALSRLRYPQQFASDKRVVEFDGEGYFEVVSDAEHPFLVKTSAAEREQDVQVLGTEFNINTYDHGESVVTTVVGGQVAVSSQYGDRVLLTSGQQSVLSSLSNTVQLHRQSADLNETMAWVDGLFVFNSEPLPQLLNRVSRWYGVTFVFESNLEDVEFQGNYFRDKGLLNLLRNLEGTGKVLFRVGQNDTDERRIYVMKI